MLEGAERGMSRAAKGNEKYGKDGMKALAKAGREGASEKELDAIRDKHDRYNEDVNPEYDDEAGMADNNLETIKRAVQGIDDIIGPGDNLPEWCQEKIAVAKSMLDTVYDYMRSEEESGIEEAWSQKYKRSINCSHPKGFSQKAHCAGKKKHNEGIEMEMTCPDCGMCETHGNSMTEVKQRLDAKCWKGYRKAGTKMKSGVRVNNCVPNESVSEDGDGYNAWHSAQTDEWSGENQAWHEDMQGNGGGPITDSSSPIQGENLEQQALALQKKYAQQNKYRTPQDDVRDRRKSNESIDREIANYLAEMKQAGYDI
jgi:hypothetical protein